jgi:hypothetical protein
MIFALSCLKRRFDEDLNQKVATTLFGDGGIRPSGPRATRPRPFGKPHSAPASGYPPRSLQGHPDLDCPIGQSGFSDLVSSKGSSHPSSGTKRSRVLTLYSPPFNFPKKRLLQLISILLAISKGTRAFRVRMTSSGEEGGKE